MSLSEADQREFRGLQERAYGRGNGTLTAVERARMDALAASAHDAARTEPDEPNAPASVQASASASGAGETASSGEQTEPSDARADVSATVSVRARVLWACVGAAAVALIAAAAFGIGALTAGRHDRVIEPIPQSEANGAITQEYTDVRVYPLSDAAEYAVGTRADGARCALPYAVEQPLDAQAPWSSCTWPPLQPVQWVDATLFGQLAERDALFGAPVSVVFRLTIDGQGRLVIDGHSEAAAQ